MLTNGERPRPGETDRVLVLDAACLDEVGGGIPSVPGPLRSGEGHKSSSNNCNKEGSEGGGGGGGGDSDTVVAESIGKQAINLTPISRRQGSSRVMDNLKDFDIIAVLI